MHNTIIRKIDDEQQPVKKRFFRRRKYVDNNTGLVFEACNTYAENKQRYLTAVNFVSCGKCKDIFEAHEIFG